VAVAVDPTSATATTQLGYGVFFYQPTTTPGDGLWDVNSTLQGLNASTDTVHGILNYSPARSVALTDFSLNSGSTLLNTRQRPLSDTLTASTNLKLMVGVATNAAGTTITDNDTVVGTLEYQAFKLNL